METHAGAGEELAGHARTGAKRLPASFFAGCLPHRSTLRRCLGQHPGAEPQPHAGRRAAISAAFPQGIGRAASLAGGAATSTAAPDRPITRASTSAINAGSTEANDLEAHFPCDGEGVPEVQEPGRPAAPGLAQALQRAAVPELQ